MLSQLIERLKKTWRRRMSLSMVLAGSALLTGCAALGVDPVRAAGNGQRGHSNEQ